MRIVFAIAVALTLLAAPPLGAAGTAPKGGCPPPPHTLVINELQVGIGAKARWIEVWNPGKASISLSNVVLRVLAPGIAGSPPTETGVMEFPLGAVVGELPPGEVLLLGHLPPASDGAPLPWYAPQVLDLGPSFVLPVCGVEVQILGPLGPVDGFSFDLCLGGALPAGDAVWQTVLSLDPAHGNICANDAMQVWCQPMGASSSSKATPGKVNAPCDLDGDGYTAATGDCDDSTQGVSPIALEICNGIDDDCDAATDEGVAAPVGTCLGAGLCAGPLPNGAPVASCSGKGGFVCTYPVGYESVQETLCDGHDNDCDGETDEGLRNACAACGPVPAESCNGLDDDCNGLTDDAPSLSGLTCGGGGVCLQATTVCASGALACSMPLAWEMTETRCDGLDNDCDGETDEAFGLGQPCVAGRGICAASGLWACAPDAGTHCVAVTGNPAAEVCGNNLDDDCDGATDEDFDVGAQCTIGLGACRVHGKRACRVEPGGALSTSSVCLATPIAPLSAERCDNRIDDDCDGFTDEPGCAQASEQGGCSARPGRGGAATPGVSWWTPLAGLLLTAALARLLRRRRDGTRR